VKWIRRGTSEPRRAIKEAAMLLVYGLFVMIVFSLFLSMVAHPPRKWE
jgi:hypothetical protein